MAKRTEPSTEQKQPKVQPEMSLEELGKLLDSNPELKVTKVELTHRGVPYWKTGDPVLRGEVLDRHLSSLEREQEALREAQEALDKFDR